ncbi:uncharacterized protein LOC103519495 [Diaphorina citri]|uniref:Uncharacterized protein LOC103519495 n=1 Tax=Diaphorina citri TaxID=121845 RepID=A0A3Q0JEA0_DIACI|nr:uncharacterized protein LOC103519495 [Diaphorina citri]
MAQHMGQSMGQHGHSMGQPGPGYYPYEQYHHGYQIPVAGPMGGGGYCEWPNSVVGPAPGPEQYSGASHVVQMGNMLRVVPSEYPQASQPGMPGASVNPAPMKNLVQLGNMIQVIPTAGAPGAIAPSVPPSQALAELQNIPGKKLINLPLPPGSAADVGKEY